MCILKEINGTLKSFCQDQVETAVKAGQAALNVDHMQNLVFGHTEESSAELSLICCGFREDEEHLSSCCSFS